MKSSGAFRIENLQIDESLKIIRKSENNREYIGQINQIGDMEGVGRMNIINGSLFEGEFKNDQRNGAGREILKKG